MAEGRGDSRSHRSRPRHGKHRAAALAAPGPAHHRRRSQAGDEPGAGEASAQRPVTPSLPELLRDAGIQAAGATLKSATAGPAPAAAPVSAATAGAPATGAAQATAAVVGPTAAPEPVAAPAATATVAAPVPAAAPPAATATAGAVPLPPAPLPPAAAAAPAPAAGAPPAPPPRSAGILERNVAANDPAALQSMRKLRATAMAVVDKDLADVHPDEQRLARGQASAIAQRERAEAALAKLSLRSDDPERERLEALVEINREREKALAAKRAPADKAAADKAAADKAAIEAEATSPAALMAVIQRRRPNATVAPAERTDLDAGRLNAFKPLQRSDKNVNQRSEMADGTIRTRETPKTVTFDPVGGILGTSAVNVTETKGQVVTADKQQVVSGASLAGNQLNIVRGYSSQVDKVDSSSGKPVLSRDLYSEMKNRGVGGATTTIEKAKIENGTGYTEKTTKGIVRDGTGKVVASKTDQHVVGDFRSDGTLDFGVDHTRKMEGGVVAGPEGLGATGGLSSDAKIALGNGAGLNVNAGADVKATVGVVELKLDPPIYLLVTTITASVKGGTGGSFQHDTGSKNRFSAGLNVSGSGVLTMKFSHTMSAPEVNAYLTVLKTPAGAQANGRFKEFGIAAACVNGGVEALKEAYFTARGMVGEAAWAKEIPEGASVELSGDLKGEVGLALGGRAPSGTGLGVEAAMGGSRTGKLKVGRLKGLIGLTLEDTEGDSLRGGLNAAYVAVSGGVTAERRRSRGRGITLQMSPDHPGFDALYEQIRVAANNVHGIDALNEVAKAHPDLTVQRTGSWSHDLSGAANLGVGPLVSSLAGTAGRTDVVTTNEKGEMATAVGGTSSVTGKIGAYGVDALASRGEVFAANVEGNVFNAETAVSEVQTSADKSANMFAGKVPGMIIGGARGLENKVDIAGMHISDADLQALVRRAKSWSEWTDGVDDPDLLQPWLDVATEINAHANDKAAIARALRDFVGTRSTGGRIAVLENTVRPYRGLGGDRVEWLEETQQHKTAFDALIFGNPLATARTTAATKPEDAIKSIKSMRVKLAAIEQSLEANSGRFKRHTTFVEMSTLLHARDAEMQAEIQIISSGMKQAAKATPPKPVKAAQAGGDYSALGDFASMFVPKRLDPDDPACVRALANVRALNETILSNRAHEQELFRRIEAGPDTVVFPIVMTTRDERTEQNLIEELAGLHLRWNAQIQQATALAASYGMPFDSTGLTPDAQRFKQLDGRYGKRARTRA